MAREATEGVELMAAAVPDEPFGPGLTAAGLPRSWSREEVTAAFGISVKRLTALIKDGKVGFCFFLAISPTVYVLTLRNVAVS